VFLPPITPTPKRIPRTMPAIAISPNNARRGVGQLDPELSFELFGVFEFLVAVG